MIVMEPLVELVVFCAYPERLRLVLSHFGQAWSKPTKKRPKRVWKLLCRSKTYVP